MQKLSEQSVIELIKKKIPFEATLLDNSLHIRITEYVPCVGTAIHHGHTLRASLQPECMLTEKERRYEEDARTGEFLSALPIYVIGLDSRYEYDLNRSPSNCIYDTAWDKKVWKSPLNKAEKQISLEKHARFFRIMSALIQQLENKFGHCLLFDIHSYNFQRLDRSKTPTFNIGTHFIDTERWQPVLDKLTPLLKNIHLPNLDVSVALDDVFQGKGYQAEYGQEHWKNTLVIPLEIKKVYMDEETEDMYPLVLEQLRQGLYHAMASTALMFSDTYCKNSIQRISLMSSEVEDSVYEIDQRLYELSKKIETLYYIHPTNLQKEKRTFFAKKFRYEPNFTYRQVRLQPYEFREKLYRLPISDISDPVLRNLYQAVVDTHSKKIELITTIGTPSFVYNCLSYYGEPSATDIANAKFLLHAPLIESLDSAPLHDAEYAKQAFIQAAEDYQIECSIEISTSLVAKAMVKNTQRKVVINKEAKMSARELQALIHHELGVHMVTSLNAKLQPFHIFSLGLPGNTHTQEGLAILSEHLSGNLTVTRLHELAQRVMGVVSLLKGHRFSETFAYLVDTYKMEPDKAFMLTTRIYRGGGFTKDYLYLKGLRDLLEAYAHRDISMLFIGKTSLPFLDVLQELKDRQILPAPKYIPAHFKNAVKSNPILNYLVKGIL